MDGGVAIVTLNALDRRNALTPVMADELIATFHEVDAKPEVGALVDPGGGQVVLRGWGHRDPDLIGKDPAAPGPTRVWGRSTTPSTGWAR